MENLISTESTYKNTIFDTSSKKRKSMIIDIDKMPLNLNKSLKFYNKFVKKQNDYNDLIQLKDQVDKMTQLNLKMYKQLMREQTDQQETKQMQKSIEIMRQNGQNKKQNNYLGYLNELIILEKKNLSLKEQINQRSSKKNRSQTFNKKPKKQNENQHHFSIFQLQKKIKDFVDDEQEKPQIFTISQQFESKQCQTNLKNCTKREYQSQLDKNKQKKNHKLNYLLNKRLSKDQQVQKKVKNEQITNHKKVQNIPKYDAKIKNSQVKQNNKQQILQKTNRNTRLNKPQQKVNKNIQKNFQKNKKNKIEKPNNLKQPINLNKQIPQKSEQTVKQTNQKSIDKIEYKIELEYEILKQNLIEDQEIEQNQSLQENLSIELSQYESDEIDQHKSKNSRSTVTIIKDEKMHSEMFQEMNEENMSEKSESSDPESFEKLIQERMDNKQILSRYTFGYGKLEFNSQKQVCVNQFPVIESIKEHSASDLGQEKSFSTLEQKDSNILNNPFEYKKIHEQSIKGLDSGQLILKHSANILSYKQDSKNNVFFIEKRSSNSSNSNQINFCQFIQQLFIFQY